MQYGTLRKAGRSAARTAAEQWPGRGTTATMRTPSAAAPTRKAVSSLPDVAHASGKIAGIVKLIKMLPVVLERVTRPPRPTVKGPGG
jgi:hypothetical protein